MRGPLVVRRHAAGILIVLTVAMVLIAVLGAQQMVTETRDPRQAQDEAFARAYKEWTGEPRYGSPLVDHLPVVKGIPTPKDVLGYYVGAPQKLTFYADILKYYRTLAAATPRVKVETIGKSEEGRELVVVWVSSEQNMKELQQNRDRLAKLADPRGLSDVQIRSLISTTKPDYHLIGGLHSTETGSSEMLMELVYRIATETSPLITQIRNNVYVSVTPAADADGRDRAVDWFYLGLETAAAQTPARQTTGTPTTGAQTTGAPAPGGRAGAATAAAGGAVATGTAAAPGTATAAGAAPTAGAPPAAGTRPAAGTTAASAGPATTSSAAQAGEQQGAQETGRGGGPGAGGAVPYWGKYVFHDNNRDINIALMQMRALTDWYYTAHPPIMHDLHESMSLLYTYSGGPPQNPNLDPLLFAELPWFSNWELAQMTKWGMPGVYTHAFMDGWSPGYLGSVAYNHNGVMKMYETQSGRDPVAPGTGRAGAGEEGRDGSAAAAGRGAAGEGRGDAAQAGRGAQTETGRGAGAAATGRAGTGEGRGDAAQAGRGAQAETGRGAGAAATGRAGTGEGRGDAAQAGRGAQAETGRGAQPETGRGTAGGRGDTAQAGRGAQPEAGRGEGGGRGPALPTGRGGTQDREWFRGLPVPPNAAASFTRRDNTNYQETGVLSSLQLTSMFPNVVVENFYVKSRNSIEDGKTKPPYGFIIPVQREMTKVAELIRILRVQGIEVGQAAAEIKLGDASYPVGSYVIKRDQPYGRLAKNLLEKQVYPDARLTTYDDSGWTMGLEMLVDVKEIADPAVLKLATVPVKTVTLKGKISGTGAAGLAVAHLGSNNMIALRYKLDKVPMKIAEKSFTAEGVEFPAGSFIIAGPISPAARTAIEELGLTAAALTALPTVPSHDASAPRIAIYSQWTSTQDLGWYRLSFDRFGIPYDLIYKEQVRKGDLRSKYDVILMAAQNINRQTVFQAPAARPQPYQKSDKHKFLGAYGETPDMTGGFGQEGVDAFAKFLEGGGTLITAGAASRFPIEFGWAHTVDVEAVTGVTAQRPIVQAEISRPEHPIFYGYSVKTLPVKYVGGFTFRVGIADQGNILGRYTGGESSVLSGLMVGADLLRQKPFAVDLPRACNGKGRVILFANNPVYRWQNHGEFNMMFNAVMNWSYVPPPPPAPPVPPASGGRGGSN